MAPCSGMFPWSLLRTRLGRNRAGNSGTLRTEKEWGSGKRWSDRSLMYQTGRNHYASFFILCNSQLIGIWNFSEKSPQGLKLPMVEWKLRSILCLLLMAHNKRKETLSVNVKCHRDKDRWQFLMILGPRCSLNPFLELTLKYSRQPV